MKIIKRIVACAAAAAALIGLAALGIHAWMESNNCEIRFPLEDVADDGAEYVMLRYGPDSIYVIDDTDALLDHRYDVFVVYPRWLDDSTGDGYYHVYRNGECIFSSDIIKNRYFDFFLTRGYDSYTLEEYYSLEQFPGS